MRIIALYGRALLTAAFVLFLTLSMSACDSGGDDDDDDNNGLGTMKAEVDGDPWTATNALATRITALGFTSLTIAGANAASESMTISIVNITSEGTFSLGGSNVASMSYTNAAQESFFATSGTMTIDDIDSEHVSGSYSFDAASTTNADTAEITDGEFNVPYGPGSFGF